MDDVAEREEKSPKIWVTGVFSASNQETSKSFRAKSRGLFLPPFRPRKKVIFQLGTASAHLAVEAAQLVCDLMDFDGEETGSKETSPNPIAKGRSACHCCFEIT